MNATFDTNHIGFVSNKYCDIFHCSSISFFTQLRHLCKSYYCVMYDSVCDHKVNTNVFVILRPPFFFHTNSIFSSRFNVSVIILTKSQYLRICFKVLYFSIIVISIDKLSFILLLSSCIFFTFISLWPDVINYRSIIQINVQRIQRIRRFSLNLLNAFLLFFFLREKTCENVFFHAIISVYKLDEHFKKLTVRVLILVWELWPNIHIS